MGDLVQHMGPNFQLIKVNYESASYIVQREKHDMESSYYYGLETFSQVISLLKPGMKTVSSTMKGTITQMHNNFKSASDHAKICNDEASKALELCTLMDKQISDKKCETERELSENNVLKIRYDNDKTDAERSLRNAKERVDSANRRIREAESKQEKTAVGGGAVTGGYAVAGAVIGSVFGPLGTVIGASIAGGISGGVVISIFDDLNKEMKCAEVELDSSRRKVNQFDNELREVTRKINSCNTKLDHLNNTMGYIHRLKDNITKEKRNVSEWSTKIKECLTVIETTWGRSNCLQKEARSDIPLIQNMEYLLKELLSLFEGESFASRQINCSRLRLALTAYGEASKLKSEYSSFLDV